LEIKILAGTVLWSSFVRNLSSWIYLSSI